jgi:hypothetical protein
VVVAERVLADRRLLAARRSALQEQRASVQAEAATVLQAAARGWAVRGAVGGVGLQLLQSVVAAEEGRLAVARRKLQDEAVELEREAAVREARLSLDQEREALAEERRRIDARKVELRFRESKLTGRAPAPVPADLPVRSQKLRLQPALEHRQRLVEAWTKDDDPEVGKADGRVAKLEVRLEAMQGQLQNLMAPGHRDSLQSFSRLDRAGAGRLGASALRQMLADHGFAADAEYVAEVLTVFGPSGGVDFTGYQSLWAHLDEVEQQAAVAAAVAAPRAAQPSRRRSELRRRVQAAGAAGDAIEDPQAGLTELSLAHAPSLEEGGALETARSTPSRVLAGAGWVAAAAAARIQAVWRGVRGRRRLVEAWAAEAQDLVHTVEAHGLSSVAARHEIRALEGEILQRGALSEVRRPPA